MVGNLILQTFGVAHILLTAMDSQSREQHDLSVNDKEQLSRESEQAVGAVGAESNVTGECIIFTFMIIKYNLITYICTDIHYIDICMYICSNFIAVSLHVFKYEESEK